MARTTSMATVKIQKRAKLAEKLKAVFEVSEIEEVIAGTCPCSVWALIPEQNYFPELPCWLLRSVCMWTLLPLVCFCADQLSAARIHVPHQLAYLLFCAYAVTRGWWFTDPLG
jgi:hypothetical protein